MHSVELERNSKQIQIFNNNFNLSFWTENQSVFLSFVFDKLQLHKVTSALLFKEVKGKKSQFISYLPYLSNGTEFLPVITDFENEIGSGKEIKLKALYAPQGSENSTDLGIPCIWVIRLYMQINSNFPGSESIREIPYLTSQILIDFIPEQLELLHLLGFAPLYAKNHGFLNLSLEKSTMGQNSLDNISFYSNGWQSWSNNYILTKKRKWPSSPVQLGRINLENQDTTVSGFHQSEYHSVISSKNDSTALVLGFITLKDQFSRILMDPLSKDGTFSWLCAYSQTDGIALKKLNLGCRKSELLMISLISKPQAYEVLTEICRIGGKLANVPLNADVIAGWCSWYYYYTKVTENDIIKNLEYFKRHSDVSVDLIQLDDGYQQTIGDWGIDGQFNSKFPHGLKWLVNKIHKASLKAGLWIAPFFSNEKSLFYKKYPDWALRNRQKKIINTCSNWGLRCSGIDLTRSDALEYLKNWGTTITKDWGFDFLKIDFLYASAVLGGMVSNPTFTRAQMIRRGVQAIREGIGESTFLLGCGAPLGPCVGLVNAMRIGMDVKEQWNNQELLFYNIGKVTQPSLKIALRSTIQRSYMHNTWWTNDPDCVIVREDKCRLTLDEIILEITVFGLSGGQLLISDDETKISPERMNLLKKLLPPYSPPFINQESQKNNISLQPIPLDMFESKNPSIYARSVNTSFGFRHLCAVINWQNKTISRTLPIQKLLAYDVIQQFQTNSKCLIFDFWNEEVLGIFDSIDETINIELPKHGCRYLTIVPLSIQKNNELIFISSTLHICQGAREIKEVVHNKKKISIKLELPGEHIGYLYFLLPEKTQLTSPTNSVELSPYKSYQVGKVHTYLDQAHEVILEI